MKNKFVNVYYFNNTLQETGNPSLAENNLDSEESKNIYLQCTID